MTFFGRNGEKEGGKTLQVEDTDAAVVLQGQGKCLNPLVSKASTSRGSPCRECGDECLLEQEMTNQNNKRDVASPALFAPKSNSVKCTEAESVLAKNLMFLSRKTTAQEEAATAGNSFALPG